MAFDGGFLKKITDELNLAVECHVDKIYQPSKDELVFLLRKKNFVKRLLITAKSGFSRIHFTENKYENPLTPPMFCMLVRKHLSAARLVSVLQPSTERVVKLIFSSSNEMGDIVNISLICELIGNQSNIILVNQDGRIIDSLRHSDIETSVRLIQPGAVYEYPPSRNKLNPINSDIDVITREVLSQNVELDKAFLNSIEGFSPLITRELAFLCENKKEYDRVFKALNIIINDLKNDGVPTLLLKEDSTPFDFTYTDINQYGDMFKKQTFESYSLLLDAFYSERDKALRINHSASDIIKLVTNLKSRTEKKLSLRLVDLKKCDDREKFRIYGELIKANLYSIKPGSKFADVQNYYDEDLKTIRIPLNPAISPSDNAAKFFKEYKKTYTAQQTLTELTVKDREEIVYFDSVLDAISRAGQISEISEIRDELTEAGYIKKSLQKKSAKAFKPTFNEIYSSEGYRILIGKNNKQNDYITTKLASKGDMWFHTKNIPGSHVVVFCDGNEISDETIIKAATLAAVNSKAGNSSQIPVDYTRVKYVKKPNGAKPGMVIYTTNKTVYVNPDLKGE